MKYLFQPLDLHVVSIHSCGSLGVEHGSSLSNGHWLVVVDSKHMVEIWHGCQIAAWPAVVASDLLRKLAILGQCVSPPWVGLQTL